MSVQKEKTLPTLTKGEVIDSEHSFSSEFLSSCDSLLGSLSPKRAITKAFRLEGEKISLDSLSTSSFSFGLSQPVYVGAFGKAAAAMSEGFLKSLSELGHTGSVSGRILCPKETASGLELGELVLEEVREQGSNKPTTMAVQASERLVKDIEELSPDTVRVFLVSGGGSKILLVPEEGFSLEDFAYLNDFLDRAGADIEERNAVLSVVDRLKMGGMARIAAKGPILSLVISDVMSDDLEVIASGATVDAASSSKKARAVLDKYNSADKDLLQRISSISDEEGSLFPAGIHSRIISSNSSAVERFKESLTKAGFSVVETKAGLEGETETVAKEFVASLVRREKANKKSAIIWGGETTVSEVPAGVKGGRNQHFAGVALLELLKTEFKATNFLLGSFGTDGEDGPTEYAGALIDESALGQECSASKLASLENLVQGKKSHDFFLENGGHIDFGGLTQTNVGDIMFALFL